MQSNLTLGKNAFDVMTSVASTDAIGSAVLIERRLGRRQRVFLAGKALARGRVIDVTFRDLSARGARLLVSEPIAHAGELPVVILREGLILQSRIIWAREPMFGIEFREAIDIEAECPDQYAALAEACRGWKSVQTD